MTNFPPETYLAAARIAYPNCRVELEPCPFDSSPFVVIKKQTVRGWERRGAFYPHNKGDHYRALREALDKEYGIRVQWNPDFKKWVSTDFYFRIEKMFDDEITNLMMKNVEALVEAGVLQEADHENR